MRVTLVKDNDALFNTAKLAAVNNAKSWGKQAAAERAQSITTTVCNYYNVSFDNLKIAEVKQGERLKVGRKHGNDYHLHIRQMLVFMLVTLSGITLKAAAEIVNCNRTTASRGFRRIYNAGFVDADVFADAQIIYSIIKNNSQNTNTDNTVQPYTGGCI